MKDYSIFIKPQFIEKSLALFLGNMMRIIKSLVTATLVLAERMRSGVAYNPFSRDVIQDPYSTFAALREHSPIHRSLLTGCWIVSRYSDVETILKDHEGFSNNPKWRRNRRGHVLPPGPDDYSTLLVDPPRHTWLRKIVGRGFSYQAIVEWEPMIRDVVENLIDNISNLAEFDFMKEVAHPLPLTVITRMLGIPDEDQKKFEKWSRDRARLLELTVSRKERNHGVTAGKAMIQYFTSLCEKRRIQPTHDITSLLVHESDGGHSMSLKEATDMLTVLLVAGNETTSNLIGNGMLALLKRPDQVSLLRRNLSASRLQKAVREMLRYDGPVQGDFRIALNDSEVGGTPIQKGDGLILLIGAANRDPEAFERADEFDLTRKGLNHLAFGRGIHHCVGSHLAQLQTQIVLEKLLEKFEVLELIDKEPRYQDRTVVRGLESLNLRAVRV